MISNYRSGFLNTDSSSDESVEFVMRRARALSKKSGLNFPPFLPEYLAPFQRVKQIVKADLGELSGLLLPMRDGFEIRINAIHSSKRQNFSCAHEIAHTFFFEDEGKALIKKLERKYGEKKARKWEESLCDMAASELLMPSQIFTSYASRYRFGIDAITHLSRTFGTSVSPTVLKLCDLNPRYCFVIHWAREKSVEGSDLKLRAAWLTWSKKRMSPIAGRFVKRNISNKSQSILEAYKSDSPTYSVERMAVGNFTGNCQIWSQGFDSGERRFVISMIFPEDDNYEDTY